MDKWCHNELKWRLEFPWAIWMDKWCQNEHKWRLEYHEQYGWTNDAKMNSNDDLNPMSNMDGQMMPKWTHMKLKWRFESHEQYGWTNDVKNELKWWLESHEQYGWTNDAKMNSNEDSNPVSNMDGQMMPKWTQMKTWISWAIWMDKWCKNELKWRHLNTMSNMDGQMMPKWTQMNSNKDSNISEQYGWTNDAKMNSNEDLNPMRNMDGQMMPKWTQMKNWISWAIWMDKWCQN